MFHSDARIRASMKPVVTGSQWRRKFPAKKLSGNCRLDLAPPKASRRMIVHQSDGLHKRVANGGAHKLESPALQILAHRIRLGGAGRNLRRLDLLRFSPNELPDVGVETPELLLHLEKRIGILDRRRDLQTVADDAFVAKQLFRLLGVIARHLRWIETVKRLPVIF